MRLSAFGKKEGKTSTWRTHNELLEDMNRNPKTHPIKLGKGKKMDAVKKAYVNPMSTTYKVGGG